MAGLVQVTTMPAQENLLNPNRLRYGSFFDWYAGNLGSLYTRVAHNQVNGLAQMSPDELTTRFNYFGAASRFYIDAMLGDIPDTVLPYYTLLEKMVRHWAVTGEYCIVVQGGIPHAVRPDYVWPISYIADADTPTGYIFVFPISTPYGSPTGKARVIEYDAFTGQAIASIRDYAVGVLGDRPFDVSPVTIDRVIYEDTGDGFYDDVEGIVRELNIRMAFIQSALNSTSLSLLQANPDRIGNFRGRGDITPKNVAQQGKTGLGLIVEPPFTGEYEAKFIERSGQGLAESLDYMRLLLGQLSVMSGVPDYIYGVSLNQNPSEVERILFAGQARITRLRRAIEGSFAELGVSITFSSDPFTTKRSRINNTVSLFQADIIDRDEARASLQYPAADRGRDQRQNMRQIMGIMQALRGLKRYA